jgi:hypothetical protein
MYPGLLEAPAVLAPPRRRLGMLDVEVERVEPGDRARRDADQRAGVLRPEGAELVRVARGILEAVRCRRTLIRQAGEYGDAGSGEFKGGTQCFVQHF